MRNTTTAKVNTKKNKTRYSTTGESQRTEFDVAIVGAGAAGLYAAWRLLSVPGYRTRSIALFDAADRVGGRILSVTLPEVPYVAELGAMRYLPEQIITRSLVEDKLQLQHGDFTFETEGYFLRGKQVSQHAIAFAKAASPAQNVFPYNVDASEKGKTPIELIVLAIQRALRVLQIPNLEARPEARGTIVAALLRKLHELDQDTVPSNLVGRFTGKEWRLIKRYGCIDGRPLYEMEFWDLIRRFLSQEGYNLAYAGGGGYQYLNAADALVWFLSDFAGSPYRTIAGGMGKLIDELSNGIIDRVRSPPGELGVVNLGWGLREVRRQANRGRSVIRLTFGVGKLGAANVPMKTISATTVILALPQRALKSIKFYDFQMERGESNERAAQRFNSCLDTVTPNPLFKACIVYERPWWREEKVPSCFRVFTDLPLRHIYHFGAERQRQLSGTGKRSLVSMLLLFVDARYANYWKRLHEMTPDRGSGTSRKGLNQVLGVYGTGDALQAQMQDLLGKVSGKVAPTPVALILKHWEEPYHSGWHAWNVGARSWEVAEKLVRPFLDSNLFICGEAFSSEQGWIEGAFKSVERVLERLGVPSPPSWVDPAEYEEQRELWV
jgi:monoamine oxidase